MKTKESSRGLPASKKQCGNERDKAFKAATYYSPLPTFDISGILSVFLGK